MLAKSVEQLDRKSRNTYRWTNKLCTNTQNRPDQCDIIWKILHRNITYQDERILKAFEAFEITRIEAFEIHNCSENIMNGCI
jgi:hypothetical protein